MTPRVESSHWHRPIRLSPESYIGCRWHFVTICTYGRRRYFQKNSVANWLLRVLKEESGREYFAVRAYCLMPDHLHLLLQGVSLNANLPQFVEKFKQKTTHLFWLRHGKALWQRSFYDHILRGRDAPGDVAWYIWLNPVRAGLAKKAEEYLHSGPFVRVWDPGEAGERSWMPPREGRRRPGG